MSAQTQLIYSIFFTKLLHFCMWTLKADRGKKFAKLSEREINSIWEVLDDLVKVRD